MGDYVVTSGLTDNGILGKTDVPAKIFKRGTITVDMFGCPFYRQFQYKMVTHARVFSLKPIFAITDGQGLFLSNSLKFLSKEFGYENMCSWEKIKEKTIQLPQYNGKINFYFMENFIAELEARQYAELEAYLSAAGLKDTHLSAEEKQALQSFDTVEWKLCKMDYLFQKVESKKLLFQAGDLPKHPTEKCTLPCLTSSFRNQGLNYYVPREGATVLQNVISIPSNSDVYRAYYQSKEFTVLSDAYAIRWKDCKHNITNLQYLFFVSCINKVTDLPIYSYKNKLGGWHVVRNKYIQVPVKDGEIDFNFMSNFISAIQKLVIRNIVAYSDKKLDVANRATNK